MKRTIIKTALISKDRLKSLQQLEDGPGLRRLAIQGGVYFATAIGLVFAVEQPGLWVPLLLANAVVQFGMFGMLHESCHQTAFASRNLNLFAGWIAALAQPMTPALMRAFHFEHHRHTHDLARDPELAGLSFMQAWPRHLIWLFTMTGVPLLIARFGWAIFAALVPAGPVWEKVLPFVKPSKRRRITWEARGLVLIHGALLTAAATALPGIGLIYAAMLLSHAGLAFYVTCEHRGLPAEGTILERTRSLEVSAVIRWLLWNMPYHAEHHAWPAVPFHKLGDVRAEVESHLVHLESPWRLHLRGGRGRAMEFEG